MSKNILGVSALFHDAAVALIKDDQIAFAGHSERYGPKTKLDKHLNPELMKDCFKHGIPDEIAWYEKPLKKKQRQIYAGEWKQALQSNSPKKYLKPYFNGSIGGLLKHNPPLSTHEHHYSHACAGYYTSPFRDATIVVIDAIGEWDTLTIWEAKDQKITKLHSTRYPHSLGLLYTAFTDHIGLKPLHEEYITMGMAAYGTDLGQAHLEHATVADAEKILFRKNLHIGFDDDEWKDVKPENLAAAAQSTVEKLIMAVMRRARELVASDNLVYMGGVALNCVANTRLEQLYDRVWIMPNPGDAGSSLGAAALVYQKQLDWQNAYLGHNIEGEYPVKEIIHELDHNRICGVASGRAEFGPRALGNRSLLADPRGNDIKDQVNEIKRRQKFRPFAPIVLAEHYNENFTGPANPYMQFTSTCTNRDLYPAICHVDGTSRVQTVEPDGSGVRQLLEAWYAKTGCPMLLNTSLNIRGEPMVNDRADADRFEQLYGIKVCS